MRMYVLSVATKQIGQIKSGGKVKHRNDHIPVLIALDVKDTITLSNVELFLNVNFCKNI